MCVSASLQQSKHTHTQHTHTHTHTHTAAAAQRCVELLRRRQAGVATCLILEKQRHLAGAMDQKVTPPPGKRCVCGCVCGCVCVFSVGARPGGGHTRCASAAGRSPCSYNDATNPLHAHTHAHTHTNTHTCACFSPGSERLFDLVRVKDAGARLAFWYALRNTLVVTDMDTASK